MTSETIDNLKFVGQVRKLMNDSQLMLSYRGEMSQEIVMALLNLTENKLNQTNFDLTIKSRVFGVMVECLQNITHHIEKSEYAKYNMFMIGCSNIGYIIYSGNVVQKEKIRELKEKIQKE